MYYIHKLKLIIYVVVCLPRPMEGMGRLQFSDLFPELSVPLQAAGVVVTFESDFYLFIFTLRMPYYCLHFDKVSCVLIVEGMSVVVNVMLSLMSVLSPPPALCNLSVRTAVRLCILGVLALGVSLVS